MKKKGTLCVLKTDLIVKSIRQRQKYYGNKNISSKETSLITASHQWSVQKRPTVQSEDNGTFLTNNECVGLKHHWGDN